MGRRVKPGKRLKPFSLTAGSTVWPGGKVPEERRENDTGVLGWFGGERRSMRVAAKGEKKGKRAEGRTWRLGEN